MIRFLLTLGAGIASVYLTEGLGSFQQALIFLLVSFILVNPES